LGYSLADRNERLKEADELISRAYQILPQDPHILDSVGWVKFRLGDNVQAEEYLRAAFAQMPQAEVAAHLGEVLWVQGRRDEAREIWRQGVELEPGNTVLLDTMRRFGVSP
jgi:Flp pilus assembly protein TadD